MGNCARLSHRRGTALLGRPEHFSAVEGEGRSAGSQSKRIVALATRANPDERPVKNQKWGIVRRKVTTELPIFPLLFPFRRVP